MRFFLRSRSAVDAGDAGGFLDHALERVIGFRASGAAIGADRRRVGEDEQAGEIDLGNAVHAGQAARHVHGVDVAARRRDIGAFATNVAHAQRQEFSAVVERELGLCHRVASLRVGHEGFRARRLPAHRAAEFFRRHQQHRIFRIDRRFHAEGAADVGGEHPQLVVGHPHHRGGVVAQPPGALRAGVKRVAVAFLVVDAGGAARFHRGDHQALVHDRDASPHAPRRR